MGPIRCPETSVNNYHTTTRNNPEDHRFHSDIIRHFIMSDEAHYELAGCVNKQNMRYCSEANPNELLVKLLHSHSVTVWSGILVFGIIGPYFFRR
jgi:hypothetical protein